MATNEKVQQFEKVSETMYVLNKDYRDDMRVPGHIYVSEKLMNLALKDNALKQVANVATLPGIVRASYAMPDIHWGYGFTIGGVAAFDPENGGIVSPGGVGYDINCGVRLIRSDIEVKDVKKQIEKLTHEIFRAVPVGVGRGGEFSFEGKKPSWEGDGKFVGIDRRFFSFHGGFLSFKIVSLYFKGFVGGLYFVKK